MIPRPPARHGSLPCNGIRGGNLRRRFAVLGRLAVALVLLSSASSAMAIDYRVEVILFEHLQPAGTVTPGPLYYPLIRSAFALGSENARAAGFTHLADDALGLAREARKLTVSSRYRVLQHTSWQQPGLNNRDALAVRFSLGSAFDLFLPDDLSPFDTYVPAAIQPGPDRERGIRSTTLNGNIKVRLGRFLHMDVNLVYTDLQNERSYRLTQSRKMRSKELHYIDNERFGVLTLITPVEAAAIQE